MTNVAIYYKMSSIQQSQKVIKEIKEKILDIDAVIVGVYVDNFDEDTNFNQMIAYNLSNIDYLYINKPLSDDFDRQLIKELSRANHFEIIYFN